MNQPNPSSRSTRHLHGAEKVFAALLQMYPAAHRRQFASEMRQTFRDLYRDKAHNDRNPVAFWVGIVFDVSRGAVLERINEIRSPQIMKIYISNSASTKALLWGTILLAPSGLMILTLIVSNFFGLPLLTGTTAGRVMQITFLVQIILPIVALFINLIALLGSVRTKSMPLLSLGFVKRYFWTLVLIIAPFVWIVTLVAHDTVSCAAHYLTRLDAQGFTRCNAATPEVVHDGSKVY